TQFSPREGSDELIVRSISKLSNWYKYDYINNHKGIRSVLREVMYDTTSVGYGVIMKSWDIKQRKIIDLVENELNREMADLEGQISSMEEGGNELDISPYKEVTKIITSFEGTRLFTVPFEDIYFPNLIHGSSDLNQPPCVIVNAKDVMGNMKMKVEQGLYNKEPIEKSANKGSRLSDRSYSLEAGVKDIRDRLTGYEGQFSQYDNDERDIEYCFCTYDIDDDGFQEEIVVTRIADGEILNINYLDRVSKLGKR
ncbi:unnamed protein product, partial [marine sediment metagenome]